jgi:adenosylcobinamide kinase / adenosylcobinamide-phosphate guanylyltransferase
MPLTLVTGPVRSGKSRFVLERAKASGLHVRYVATAARESGDAEWDARIERHKQDRPATWTVVESATLAPRELQELFHSAAESDCVVVDALGTWLAARMSANLAEPDDSRERFEATMDEETAQLADAMLHSRAVVIVVAEEVGWDVVPVAPSARLFRDVLGRMKQRLAARANGVYLIVCGYALDLRELGRVF